MSGDLCSMSDFVYHTLYMYMATLLRNKLLWLKLGPLYGYNANAVKTWLITKAEFHQKAQEVFEKMGVSITLDIQVRYNY